MVDHSLKDECSYSSFFHIATPSCSLKTGSAVKSCGGCMTGVNGLPDLLSSAGFFALARWAAGCLLAKSCFFPLPVPGMCPGITTCFCNGARVGWAVVRQRCILGKGGSQKEVSGVPAAHMCAPSLEVRQLVLI